MIGCCCCFTDKKSYDKKIETNYREYIRDYDLFASGSVGGVSRRRRDYRLTVYRTCRDYICR